MSDQEIVRAWKDPEADRFEAPSPLGEPDLADLTGGMAPITGSGEVSWCGTCYIATYGCC